MTFERFDVVVVPFPFTDAATTKRRPALVLSHHAFNAAHDHVVLAMITTAAGSAWASDTPISAPGAAGLHKACKVRQKLFTLPSAQIERRVGALVSADQKAVEAALATVL